LFRPLDPSGFPGNQAKAPRAHGRILDVIPSRGCRIFLLTTVVTVFTVVVDIGG
jgi:hypothetical protein